MKVSKKEAHMVLSYLLSRMGCTSFTYDSGFMHASTHALACAVLCYCKYNVLSSYKMINCGCDIENREKLLVSEIFKLSSQGYAIVLFDSLKDAWSEMLKPFTLYEQIAIEAALQCNASFQA